MKLTHGNKPNDIKARIEIRAEGICKGHHAAEEPDPIDINSNEREEIEAAKTLAAKWQAGNW